jgi:hypothetical protein
MGLVSVKQFRIFMDPALQRLSQNNIQHFIIPCNILSHKINSKYLVRLPFYETSRNSVNYFQVFRSECSGSKGRYTSTIYVCFTWLPVVIVHTTARLLTNYNTGRHFLPTHIRIFVRQRTHFSEHYFPIKKTDFFTH